MNRYGKNKWIQKALKHRKRGALHRDMGIPEERKIPMRTLAAHIARLRRQLRSARGARRDRIRTRLRRAYLGRTLKARRS